MPPWTPDEEAVAVAHDRSRIPQMSCRHHGVVDWKVTCYEGMNPSHVRCPKCGKTNEWIKL